jgi:hypothetical protein
MRPALAQHVAMFGRQRRIGADAAQHARARRALRWTRAMQRSMIELQGNHGSDVLLMNGEFYGDTLAGIAHSHSTIAQVRARACSVGSQSHRSDRTGAAWLQGHCDLHHARGRA